MDPFYEDVADKLPQRLTTELEDLQRTYANELETYLVGRATAEARTWHRDYSSVEAYLHSVEPNRRAWRDVLGHFEHDAVAERKRGQATFCRNGPQGASLQKMPVPFSSRPFHDGAEYHAEWVQFEFLPGVVSRAVVAVPRAPPRHPRW